MLQKNVELPTLPKYMKDFKNNVTDITHEISKKLYLGYTVLSPKS